MANEFERSWNLKWRVPWDWLLAVLIVLALEAGVRVLEGKGRLASAEEWQVVATTRKSTVGESAPVAVVGNSLTRALDADEIGRALRPDAPVRVRVAEFTGGRAGVIAYATEHVVLPVMRPEVLVWCIDSQSVNDNAGRVGAQDKIMTELKRYHERRLSWTMMWTLFDHLALYRNQFTLRHWVVDPRTAFVAPRPRASKKLGEWTLKSTPHVFLLEQDHLVGPWAEAQIRAVHRACVARGARFVIANMPLSPEYSGYWPDGWATYERYLARLRELSAEMDIEFVDLHDGSYPKDQFKDSQHLGKVAGRHASMILGQRLRERGLARPR